MQENDFQPQDWFDGAKAPQGLNKEQAWEKLQSRIDLQDTPVVSIKRKPSMWWAAAAAVAILAIGSLFFLPNGEEVMTAGKNGKSVTLPDGSEVLLDAFASVSFDADTWEESRELNLKGGAFFDVEKGSTFTVHTMHGDVQVLGTSFDIETAESLFEVACYTGRVAVTHANDRVELTPGLATAMNGNAQLTAPSEFQVFRNEEGGFHFEEASLRDVFTTLSKTYNVTFNCTFQDEMTLSLDVDAGQPLTEALDAIAAVKGLSYEVKGGTVEVLKK